jgi:hypothetical protein
MASDFQGKKLWLNMNVLFVETEKDAIVIDLRNKKHYYPNETASVMLHMLIPEQGKGPTHFDDLKNNLVKKFALTVDDAGKAIGQFCARLEQDDLLGSAEAEVPATRKTPEVDAFIQKIKVGKWAEPDLRQGVNSGGVGYVIIGYRP